jgi:signal transduction histidine kinase
MSGLTWRRDLARPVTVGVVQFAGTYATAGGVFWRHMGVPDMDLAHRLGVGVLELINQQPDLTRLDWVLVGIGPAALVVRHRHPVAVAWIAFTAMLAPAQLWFAYLSLTVAFFVAAASGHRLAAWTVLAAGYASSVWLGPLAWNRPAPSPGTALLVGAWLAVMVIAAEAARLRRERAAEAAAARQLGARHRASEERLRMARELHDMIGHNISLINIQAGVGLDLMDTQPEQARAALAAVRTASGQALAELRAMLSALRQAGEAAPRSPTPGLARLPELISLTGAAGLAVTTDLAGQPRALPAAVDLAAYRIVQESLTNAARHAGPTTVTMRIAYGEDDLSIEVADDGCPAARNGRAGNGTAASNGTTVTAAGNGIPGMRERALALGGHLDAGPRPGGGFLVSARLPLKGEP